MPSPILDERVTRDEAALGDATAGRRGRPVDPAAVDAVRRRRRIGGRRHRGSGKVNRQIVNLGYVSEVGL